MGGTDLIGGWAGVDSSADPSRFVAFLDATRARLLEMARADPARFFAHLELREGQHVLEIGCGTGDYARVYSGLLGASGRVLGIDYSTTMVEEARRRAAGSGARLEFRQGDAHRLELPDSTFDRCISNIVIQHLASPPEAIAQMVRVARPGGLVIAAEQDWETFVIDGEPSGVTRNVLNHIADSIPRGWIGRQLRSLFLAAGLENVNVAASTLTFNDFDLIDGWFVAPAAESAASAGKISEDDAAAWLADLRARNKAGRFFAAMTLFNVTGRKP
ncbi:MAG TPA: methyltransferase domain-containing protein [Thermoplasmata archaeon]|nr:methyltransferase domain-containing protein [Thermoplasmata archaeon]